MNEVFCIVNPTAAGKRVKKRWEKKVIPLFNKYNIEYEYQFTECHQHATEIAREKSNEGYGTICSVGGDGTCNQIANGILTSDKTPVFAALPIGTGNDIPSPLGIPENAVEEAVKTLTEGIVKKFDVGLCETANRYFLGVASMGFDAEVANRSNKLGKRLPGTINYILSIFLTFLRFKPYDLEIIVDGKDVSGEKMLMAIGNGNRYGAGMHICPEADPTDGMLDIITMIKLGKIKFAKLFGSVYDGEHIHIKPTIETNRGIKITVDSPKKKCLYQVDGEAVGYLPETFSILREKLPVKVPKNYRPYLEIWKEALEKKKKK